jgi:hypothetical protein
VEEQTAEAEATEAKRELEVDTLEVSTALIPHPFLDSHAT